MDTDKDGLISFDEFIRETKDEDFEKDEEWKPLTDEDQYTDEEFKEYEKLLAEDHQVRMDYLRLFLRLMLCCWFFCVSTA